ncbi:MAG: 30S ribosomal protein S4e [archaeon]
MSKKHLTRLDMPKTWPVQKKEYKWIIRPNPGAHPLEKSIPISLVIKHMLNHAKTTKEVEKILNNKEIIVNKKVIKEKKYSVGLFDVIEIPKTKECLRVLINKSNKFKLVEIKQEEAVLKPYKIINKTLLKGKKIQLNLSDSKNIIVDKDEYKTNDTIILNLETKKIQSYLKLDKGSTIYLTSGKYIGYIGIVDNIDNDTITFSADNKKIKTSKKYAFVIPKDFIKND